MHCNVVTKSTSGSVLLLYFSTVNVNNESLFMELTYQQNWATDFLSSWLEFRIFCQFVGCPWSCNWQRRWDWSRWWLWWSPSGRGRWQSPWRCPAWRGRRRGGGGGRPAWRGRWWRGCWRSPWPTSSPPSLLPSAPACRAVSRAGANERPTGEKCWKYEFDFPQRKRLERTWKSMGRRREERLPSQLCPMQRCNQCGPTESPLKLTEMFSWGNDRLRGCIHTNVPGTKCDPKSSQAVGVEEEIVAKNVRLFRSVNESKILSTSQYLWWIWWD